MPPMSSRISIVATLFALHCSMTGCGDDGTAAQTCSTNEECPSGFCKADGTCAPLASDAGVDPDGAPPADDGMSGLCTPNRDGAITLAELPLAAGRMAKFRTTTTGTFMTAGTAGAAGARLWDLSGTQSGDADTTITLLAPAGAWWAAAFPTATYATTLAAGSDLLGVFRVDATTVELLGVVSPAAGTFRTELAYDPPAQLLKLPLAQDATWTTTSSVTGVASGAFVLYDETYASTVDRFGTMTTPYGDFPVLRVATDLDRVSGITPLLSKRQFAWLAECFGGVATVVSEDFEAAAEFSNAAEIRRIAP